MSRATPRLAPGRHLGVGLLLALGVAAAPIAAQYVEEDDATRDHELKDKLYLERLRQREADPTPIDLDDARQAVLERADRLIRDRNFDVAQSETFVVRTDDPRLAPARTLELLEGFHTFFERFWQDDFELATTDETTPVYLFYSFAKYNQVLSGDWSRRLTRPKGHYAADLGLVALHTDSDAPGDLPDTLIHELAHQLIDRRLGVDRDGTPTWVTEGLASYFGYTARNADGVWQPGVVGGKNIGLMRGGSVERAAEVSRRLRAFKQAARLAARREQPIVAALLAIPDAGSFYLSERGDLNYSAAWILVHFLLHGEDGAHRAGFVQYLVGNDPSPEALYTALGLTPEEVETRFATHLGAIRTR